MTTKKLGIIATKGTLDGAYPPLILASTGAALGYEVQVYFTFYGLQILRKHVNLKVTPLGNPAMPMPIGMDKWLPVLATTLPGMEALMSMMMKRTMRTKGVASVEGLRGLCLEADVKMIACTMAMDLFGIQKGELISGIEFGGATTFFEFAGETDICLFM